MANEINIFAVTGLTLSIQLYNGATPVGSPFGATEIGLTGTYVANMPTTPYGRYVLVAMAGTAVVGSGSIFWGGSAEMDVELHELQGMNPNSPMTVTPTSRTVDTVNLVISGDGTTISTVTRS